MLWDRGAGPWSTGRRARCSTVSAAISWSSTSRQMDSSGSKGAFARRPRGRPGQSRPSGLLPTPSCGTSSWMCSLLAVRERRAACILRTTAGTGARRQTCSSGTSRPAPKRVVSSRRGRWPVWRGAATACCCRTCTGRPRRRAFRRTTRPLTYLRPSLSATRACPRRSLGFSSCRRTSASPIGKPGTIYRNSARWYHSTTSSTSDRAHGRELVASPASSSTWLSVCRGPVSCRCRARSRSRLKGAWSRSR